MYSFTATLFVMGNNTTFTIEQLKALEDAIAQGALTVSYNGKSVTYRSLDEMMRIRELMRKALGLASGKAGRIYLSHDKKLS